MTSPPRSFPFPTAATTFAIGGMSCGNCVRHLRQALVGVAGVVDADVDLSSQTARVIHRPELVTVEALAAAVVAAGYEATTLPG